MPTRHAWDDNNYEGKALRRVFTKLLRKFEKEITKDDIDLEKFQRIAHTLSLVAKTKADLAYKENRIEERLKLLEQLTTPDIKKGTIVLEALKHAKELPHKTT